MDWIKCKAGDRNAWVDAAEELIPFAEAFVRQKCPWLSPEDIEDMAVQAFREIQRQIERLPTESDFRARLAKCARFRALDAARENALNKKHFVESGDSADSTGKDPEEDTDPSADLPYESTIREEERAIAREIINSLAPEKKQLLYDGLVLEMMDREIGEKFGWGTSSVKNRKDQALNQVKKMISSDERLKKLLDLYYDEV